ncbi:hypothetical protein ACQP00_33975 [Dactylosporangium sp. CS-047395]|uniref:hypothetical protein n=1 Tax=Dactylosporangium sp. CS-047395 TaxID=3239936 RepID=UPI003D94741C
MGRRRPVLTAVMYAVVTVLVVLGAMAFMRTSLVRGDGQQVVVRVGGAVLLVGLAWLVVKAVRGRR